MYMCGYPQFSLLILVALATMISSRIVINHAKIPFKVAEHSLRALYRFCY